MAFEAYSVAIKLSLVNHVSSGLAMLSSQLKAAHGDAGQLQSRLNSIQKMATSGLMMVGAGLGIAAMFKSPLDEARQMQAETARFASLGFGDKISSQALKFAQGMETFGTSARDNMTLVSDAMAVFKDLHHAEFAAPLMAKMKFANEAVFGGEKGGANERKFMDMLKVIEFRGGLSSEKEFFTQADYVQKVITGSRNRVDASQLLQALKTGGVALTRRENEKFYLGAEPLIQEFGGQRYGTGAMSIYQNLVQARGTITAQQELYRLGLLKKDMVVFNKLGKLKKALPGAFVGSSILESEGELALLEKVLLPAFAKKGVVGDEAIIREIGMILGNRTGSGLMARIYQQMATLKKQIEANKHAMGIDELDAKAQTTYDGQKIRLHAQWRDLMLQLGVSVLPMAIVAVKGLNGFMFTLNDFLKKNGDSARILARDMLLLGGALVIGGTVRIATAAFQGFALASQLAGSRALAQTAAVNGFAGAVGNIERRGRISAATTGLIGFAGALTKIGLALLVVPDLLKIAADAGTFAGEWVAKKQREEEKERNTYHDGDGLGVMDKYNDGSNGPTISNAKAARENGGRKTIPIINAPSRKNEQYQFKTPVNWDQILGRNTLPLPPPAKTVVKVDVHNHLNPREVANNVVQTISRDASRPSSGINGYDTSMGPTFPGMPGAVTR